MIYNYYYYYKYIYVDINNINKFYIYIKKKSPNGLLIALGTENGTIFIFDAVFGTLKYSYRSN